MLKVYAYKNCGTCKKALAWLDKHKVAYKELPIRETPPGEAELKRMLAHVGDIKKLFNTSSKDYSEAGLKDTLADMTQQQAFALLRANGNLVKRPFVIGDGVGLVGFNEAVWKEALL